MFLSLALQMAIAAVAHVFVFSAKPYHYLPPSEHGKVIAEKTEEIVTVEGFKEKPAVLKNSGMQIQAPGTSITKSVQDIVVEGGQHVSSISCTHVANVHQHFSLQMFFNIFLFLHTC